MRVTQHNLNKDKSWKSALKLNALVIHKGIQPEQFLFEVVIFIIKVTKKGHMID